LKGKKQQFLGLSVGNHNGLWYDWEWLAICGMVIDNLYYVKYVLDRVAIDNAIAGRRKEKLMQERRNKMSWDDKEFERDRAADAFASEALARIDRKRREKEEAERSAIMKEHAIPEGLAKVFFESGIFKDIKSVSQATVKILAGREMGLSPMQSMTNVYILENKVEYGTEIFLSKIKKSEKYDYSVKFNEKDNKIESCDVTFYSINLGERIEIGTTNFSVFDAARLGLINKFNYKNYLDLMLFYRAAIKGIKIFCPDILGGAEVHEEYQEVIPDEKGNVDLLEEEVSLDDGGTNE
jgi:hypothetical protein